MFYAHCLPAVLKRLKENNILVAFVPANTPGFLQLCDVAVNKPWKSLLTNSFIQYYVYG